MGCCSSNHQLDVSDSHQLDILTKNEYKYEESQTSQKDSTDSHRPNDTRKVVALYNYDQRDNTDISFKKGDVLIVLDGTEEWYFAEHILTKRKGYIPGNFVANIESIESEDWFFDHTPRVEAEKMLIREHNCPGTFLVRRSEHDPNGFSLSVKDIDEIKGHHVKHYKIRLTPSGSYCVAATQAFESLKALIESYKYQPLSKNLILIQPCKKSEPILWDLGPANRDKWEIPRDEIRLAVKLGSGNFGQVHLGYWKSSIMVAVKELINKDMSPQEFIAEATIMKNSKHPKIVALYGVCTVSRPIYIIQEYMSKGSLICWLRKNREVGVKLDDLLHIAHQIALGMRHLEKLNLIHRDLAARNILLGENNIAKISDFGLARLAKGDDYSTSSQTKLPIKWTALEALVFGKFSIKSDVWSYGILLMEIFTYGKMPYSGMSSQDTLAKLNQGYRMPKPLNYNLPDEIYEKMLECWATEPQKRPTFYILADFFESYPVQTEIQYKEVILPEDVNS